MGFLRGPIHLFRVVSFCLSTLLHDVNFILRLSALKVAPWSPAAGERMQTTFLIVTVKESKWTPLSRTGQSMSPHISLTHSGKHAIPIKASDTGVLHGWESQNTGKMACLDAQTPSPVLGLSPPPPTPVRFILLPGKELKTQQK